MVILAGMLAAQALNDIVIQAWVDPVYGVDGPTTVVDNPRAGSPNLCNPSEVSPPDVLNLAGTKVLHHASYPYKTITAAINYITTVTGGGLPYTASTGAVWQYAIIHCLPGKYSRESVLRDTHNRLLGNGEPFPIDLPNRISVQGTSALNTMFDLFDPSSGSNGRGVGPAFRFGTDSNHRGEHSFVDCVSIFGARPNEITDTFELEASAIYLTRDVACSPTISNCFLFANGVGILVDEDEQDPVTHVPTVVNNTIAFNKVGLWNGDAQASLAGTTAGTAAMLLINNILDVGMFLWYEVIPQQQAFTGCAVTPVPFPPTWNAWVNSFNGSGSAFEGVDVGDLTVTSTVPPADFNAYDTTYDLVAPFLALDLPAVVAAGGARPAGPGVDLTPIIGLGGSRGALYVRDLMHIGHINAIPTGSAPYQPGNTGVSCDFDRSPGDFRLAPAYAGWYAPSGTPLAPVALNYLVDAGIGGPFPITLGNGRVLSAPPGTLPMGNSSWPYHAWMHDCEGFGNPRIVLHPGYYADTSNMAPRIDIGADEVDVHPLAGYRFGATHFLEWRDAGGGGVQSGNYHGWLLGPPWTLTPAPLPGNTTLPFESNRVLTTTSAIWGTGTYYTPTTTDVVPHLLPDIHPHWTLLPSPSPTHPVWQACRPYHNFLLYEDPTTGLINPPGSADGAFSAPQFNWIEGFSFLPIPPGAGQTWHATPGTQGNPTVFRYDIWCQNERPNGGTNQPFDDWYDMRLGVSTSQFRRFSTEYQYGNVPFGPDSGSNLQSYAVHRK